MSQGGVAYSPPVAIQLLSLNPDGSLGVFDCAETLRAWKLKNVDLTRESILSIFYFLIVTIAVAVLLL